MKQKALSQQGSKKRSLKLLKLKMESHELAKNELLFFEQERVLNRKYLKVLEDKEKLS